MAGPGPYVRERLAEAVAESRTLTEALTRLGRNPTPGSRSYARKLIARWAIDTSHLDREGVRHTERRLREAVRVSHSITEVVRHLGLAPVGGNQAHIARRIATSGVDTTHFDRAPRPRRAAGAARQDVLSLGRPADGRVRGDRLRRALLRTGVPEVCARCGTGPEWNGRPLRLEVDHLNGDWWNNRPENLALLCPNCHAVTDTYRGRKRKAAA
ncbi:HNH endonuclease [Streptomyces sp. ODS28]|uniref:HNH endonuclease signature motif containing protein n=1 Tax=Streptomyces sp. ODS28 TaxID=3136688 RepID=UPI0031EFD102